MTVYDFIQLLTEDGMELIIYSLEHETEVYIGEAREARFTEWSDYEIMSIDAPEKVWSITINID